MFVVVAVVFVAVVAVVAAVAGVAAGVAVAVAVREWCVSCCFRSNVATSGAKRILLGTFGRRI